jgi:hypothetical protein
MGVGGEWEMGAGGEWEMGVGVVVAVEGRWL